MCGKWKGSEGSEEGQGGWESGGLMQAAAERQLERKGRGGVGGRGEGGVKG